MTTLKEHQAAMVNLLASGSGIHASASRLAHALHDVLALITTQPVAAVAHTERRGDATTPGLNDKLLALDVEAVRPAQSGTTPRIKQLENTIRQLKGSVEVITEERNTARLEVIRLKEDLFDTEQLWRKSERAYIDQNHLLKLEKSTIKDLQSKLEGLIAEQAGCRKDDTQVDDGWIVWSGGECPVSVGTRVDIKLRDGHITYGFVAEAGIWSHAHAGWDIVAYRIAGRI